MQPVVLMSMIGRTDGEEMKMPILAKYHRALVVHDYGQLFIKQYTNIKKY